MAAFLSRLRRACTAAALALAIAATSLAFHVSGETPRTVVDSRGNSYQVNGAIAPFVVQLILMVVSALISYALSPKPPKPKPAALEEFDIPQSKEGQPFCWIFGECYVPDATVAYWGNLNSSPIKAKGGK